jgi:mannose/cellobiose epimerase-like protein (N-acyl-D-glucosamine 2-epimerase family)
VTEAGFAGVHDVSSAHAAFRGWMFGQALPFWAGAGNDAPGLGVHESLQLDGSPSGVPFKRVQARQVYAFSHAALLGWAPGRAVAEDAYAFMARQGARADGAWARRLSPAGDMLDPAADLYDLPASSPAWIMQRRCVTASTPVPARLASSDGECQKGSSGANQD